MTPRQIEKKGVMKYLNGHKYIKKEQRSFVVYNKMFYYYRKGKEFIEPFLYRPIKLKDYLNEL